MQMRKTSACFRFDATVYFNIGQRYGAVVRSSGAYVPPGARKIPVSPPATGGKSDIPRVAVNAPDGAAIPDKAGSPAPTATNKVGICVVPNR